jgi:serine/threonine protein kinase
MNHVDPRPESQRLDLVSTLLEGKFGEDLDLTQDVSLEQGSLIGNYQVVGLLGQGGMGAVFEAVHKDIGRRAAIKVLHPEYAQHPLLTTRFLNEARAVNMARHPGLIEIFEYGVLPEGLPFLVMEYLEGQILRSVIEQAGGAPVPDALVLARHIALALHAAHEKGIVHRDLKPANVMILPDPPGARRVKVFDFGLAKLTNAGAVPAGRKLSMTGAALGTPAYMSPEQCLGVTSVDGKADVYSLGVMLYEMLSGRLPFDAHLPFEFMAMHVQTTPPPLTAAAPQVGPEVAALTHRMLAKWPAERPDMARVAAALGQILDGAGAPAGPVSVVSTPLPAAPAVATPRRVLVVDDEQDLADTLSLFLADEGYACATLSEGNSVLEAVRRLRPHVILLDLELPGKSGYRLCWEIKSDPDLADTLVVLISAKSREEDQRFGLAMQADAYLVKPFELAQLLSVLRFLLDRDT